RYAGLDLVVEIVEFLIEASDLNQRLTPEAHVVAGQVEEWVRAGRRGALWRGTAVEARMAQAIAGQVLVFQPAARGVEHDPAGPDHARLVECLDEALEPVGSGDGVIVGESHNLAARRRHTQVARARDVGHRAAHQADLGTVSGQGRLAPGLGGALHEDHLELAVALVAQRRQCPREALRSVERADYDADSHSAPPVVGNTRGAPRAALRRFARASRTGFAGAARMGFTGAARPHEELY